MRSIGRYLTAIFPYLTWVFTFNVCDSFLRDNILGVTSHGSNPTEKSSTYTKTFDIGIGKLRGKASPASRQVISPAPLIADNLRSCSVEDASAILKRYYFPDRVMEYEFAREFSKSQEEPKWASAYRLRFPELIYGAEVPLVLENPGELENARSAIRKLYSEEDFSRIGIDINTDKFFRQYRFHCKNVGHFMSIEDYFAIRIYGVAGGCERINDATDEGKRMRNALRRLTIRQSKELYPDYKHEGYVKMEYSGHGTDLDSFQKWADEQFGRRFTPFSMNWADADVELEETKNGVQNVIVQLEIDSEWMIADLSCIFKDQIVLPPKVPLVVEEVEKVDTDIPYISVTICNDFVDKHVFIPSLMNDIED